MSGAVATTDAVGKNYTVFFDPHGVADMDRGLVFSRNGLDGTAGADFAATCAFRAAVAAFKRHRGLHEVL